jgi:hypothetical protein
MKIILVLLEHSLRSEALRYNNESLAIYRVNCEPDLFQLDPLFQMVH